MSETSPGNIIQGVLIALKFTYNLKIIYLRDFYKNEYRFFFSYKLT